MPLLLEARVSRGEDASRQRPARERRGAAAQWRPSLEIGLLNNMPDAALKATEKQFVGLLDAATGDRVVRLHLFGLPEVARGPSARAHMRSRYTDLRELWSGRLDALIVTGSEPRAPSLTEEPYWRALTEVIDWAEHNTISTVWSCLAAHAAVLHLDGIGRHRLDAKRYGLFDCAAAADEPLLAGLPQAFKIPHSRWNDLREADLAAHGYRILTRSAEAGVDMFVKRWKSLFVFFQGHPEYDRDTLFREYRRDMTRYLTAERDTPPDLPRGYFDARTERVFRAHAASASERRGPEAVARLPSDWAVETEAVGAWRSAAVGLYRNWLDHLATVKGR